MNRRAAEINMIRKRIPQKVYYRPYWGILYL